MEKLEKLRVKSEGTVDNFNPDVPGHRGQNFAIRFSGAISVPKQGRYTFYLKSDDGSCAYVDGVKVVDDDGVHPPTEKSGAVELSAGDHPILVTFFQNAAGYELSVEWEGPGIQRSKIPDTALFHVGGRAMVPLSTAPFTIDPQKVKAGAAIFASAGCALCHSLAGVQSSKSAKPLAELNADAGGCLAEQVAKGLPSYGLSKDQREALKAALNTDKDSRVVSTALPPQQQVLHAIAAMNCLACHTRGSVGGALHSKSIFFGMTGNYDLGEEGRFPPKLTDVGSKLVPGAIKQIVFESKLHVRPWMATRMPRFSPDILAFLPDALEASDAPAADMPPKFAEASAKDGRRLVGTKGLGCVNCHGVGGNKSLGIPSIDLSTVHDRLRPGWFHALLIDPPSKNPGTRMPAFWPDGKVALKDVAGGTMAGQIDAIWNYTSLGQSMPLPSGLRRWRARVWS